jgi:tellurite resistance protein TerA
VDRVTISLIKGQKADLTKTNPSITSVLVGMGWRNADGVELDFSSFVVGADGKVTRDEDLIFYGNPAGANSSVTLMTGTKLSIAGQTDREQVTVQLGNVPGQFAKIAFALTVYEGEQRKQNFSKIDDAYIRIVDPATGNELLRYNLGKDFSVETAVVVGELYRYNNDWKFNAIGSGYSGGLAALCTSFGVEVGEDPKPASPPQPVVQEQKPARPPIVIPPVNQPPAAPPANNPINLNKIELKKRGDTINLQKNAGSLGEILINLNWNQKKKGGWFGGGSNLDLDLACLYELKDGSKGVVQALGNSFGSLTRPPFIALDGDDRTGTVKTGENLRINGNMIKEFKRVIVFAFIYEGAANWAEAAGVVTIKQSGGPDIEVRMDEHERNKGMCAIAMIKNVNDQTFSIEKLVSYYAGHKQLDEAHGWGMRWVAGSK